MAKHGHRVVHITELRAGESAADPIEIAMSGVAEPREQTAPNAAGPREGASAARTLLGLPRYDLAGVAVLAVGVVIAGAALLLF